MNAGFSLSVSDLILVDDFPRIFSLDDKVMLEKFLFANGLDVNQPYDQEVVTHRNLQNQVVNCLRFVGTERSCRDWLNTGAASLEAWVSSSKDGSFRDEMRGLAKEQNRSMERDYKSEDYYKE